MVWLLNVEVPTDFPCKEIVDLAMARHGSGLPGGTVYKYGMFAALAQKNAAMLPK